MRSIKVIQVGLGPLGLKIASFIAKRNGIETIAAIDKNPEIIGKSLTSFDDTLPDIKIESEVKSVADKKPDVAILTTVSDMQRITPQILEIVKIGIPVVTTCEELSYPWLTAPDLAGKIDNAAKENNVGVIGTGVNPGFLMDSLPTFLTSVCQSVESVSVERFQNAAYRRVPFQVKIGAGTTLEEFNTRKDAGTLRHVGLTESIQFIASHLGWRLDKTEDIISPVIADVKIKSNGIIIEQGLVRGVRQVGKGYINGKAKITLTFQAAIGEPSTYDEVKVQGDPNISSRIDGGLNGDTATCAITINSCRSILKAAPGLRTMGDLPLPSFFA